MDNIYPVFERIISRESKEKKLNQKSLVIWYTGLSGSGKTTLASEVEKELFKHGYLTQLLDGDNIRVGINNNLSFTEEDREENIRRISEVSKLFVDCGIITLCAFISPTIEIRNKAKQIIGNENFVEIFVSTPIEFCEKRDEKGLYAKARNGELKNFTGISSPYEAPLNPDVTVDTSIMSLENCIAEILRFIIPKISK